MIWHASLSERVIPPNLCPRLPREFALGIISSVGFVCRAKYVVLLVRNTLSFLLAMPFHRSTINEAS